MGNLKKAILYIPFLVAIALSGEGKTVKNTSAKSKEAGKSVGSKRELRCCPWVLMCYDADGHRLAIQVIKNGEFVKKVDINISNTPFEQDARECCKPMIPPEVLSHLCEEARKKQWGLYYEKSSWKPVCQGKCTTKIQDFPRNRSIGASCGPSNIDSSRCPNPVQ